jgi:putative type II/III system pilus formation protein
MTAFGVRGWVGKSALHWLSAALVFAAVAAPAVAEESISVHLDQARVVKLPDRAATVVIGDPLIADFSIQPGNLAVITGKGYGATNVIVMDKSGAVLSEKLIDVTGPDEPTIVVYRGVTRQTYSCTPDCSPRMTLGDSSKEDVDKETQLPSDYFNKAINQDVTRNNQAIAAGAAGAH